LWFGIIWPCFFNLALKFRPLNFVQTFKFWRQFGFNGILFLTTIFGKLDSNFCMPYAAVLAENKKVKRLKVEIYITPLT